jgi:hypothetical protein
MTSIGFEVSYIYLIVVNKSKSLWWEDIWHLWGEKKYIQDFGG